MQVLLPLKEFAASKQRLSGVLSATERARLLQSMVGDVLGVLTLHPEIERVAICSRDRSALWLANYYGVDFIDEDRARGGDLNSAVNAAVSDLVAAGCRDILVAHGDLPLLSAQDISAFLRSHRRAGQRAVTIAPDRRGLGTNLLAWRPLDLFRAQYGVESCSRHSAQARALGAQLTLCELAGARCDIDEPEDLLLMLTQTNDSAAHNTVTFLYESGIAERLQDLQISANAAAGENHECA
jgi:2-phospho-L-lactate guanylyltransferase